MQLDTLNKRLLIALGLSDATAQIVIDHIDELRTEAGRLRTEVICLKQDLHDAQLGRCTCSGCGKVVGNAWRDSAGHHCLTCLAKQRDDRYGYSEIEAACGGEAAKAVAQRRAAINADLDDIGTTVAAKI